MSHVGGWTMGYCDTSSLKLWQWAHEYTLADRFFMGAFGGSFLNPQYLICACAPRHANAPASMREVLDGNSLLTKPPDSPSAHVGAVKVVDRSGGQVSPEGWSLNITQPPCQPSGLAPAAGLSLDLADPAGSHGASLPLPPQTALTIGDTLSAKGVSWAWYGGGWDAALADGRRPPREKRKVISAGGPTSPIFQPHHQPFNHHVRFAPGTADRVKHLLDGERLSADAAAGQLPAVSLCTPAGRWTQHPA